MDYPEQYPSYRYYADGRWVVVQNQTELDALDAGHAAHPGGPFPEQEEATTLTGVVDHPPDASGVTHYEAERGSYRRALELRDAGKSDEEIASALRMSLNVVRRMLGDG